MVAGLIQNEAGDYLVAQRSAQMSNAGKWEFPGGKVEEGETDEAAIVRELREELGIVVHPQHDRYCFGHQGQTTDTPHRNTMHHHEREGPTPRTRRNTMGLSGRVTYR